MAFHGINRDNLQRASRVNFDGYRRLANFLGSDGYSVDAVMLALEEDKAKQRLAVVVRDRRASNERG
jgi:hypothetical protein